MAYKVNDAVLRQLKAKHEEVCNGYLLELANMWEIGNLGYGFWVGGEIGGIYAYGDMFLGMDDIRYCVINGVTREQYLEWIEYCTWANGFGFNTPTLQDWLKGCQRVSDEKREELDEMRNLLNKAIEDEKSKF